MSKKVTAKRPNSANNVSHAKNVTKRKQKSFPDTIEKRFPYMWHINTTHES